MITTVEQMNDYVLLGLNKVATVTVSPPEFDVLINAAIMDYVEQRSKVVDRSQTMIDALRVLKAPPLVIANTGGQASEQEVFQLPYVASPAPGVSNGYMHMLNAAVKLSKMNNGTPVPVTCFGPGGWTSLRPLPADTRYDRSRDPFWEATNEEPYYDLKGTQMGVLAEADTFATQVRIEYLRYPVRISLVSGIQPEFPPHVNQEIADYAVRRHLETIESNRYQTNVQERQLNA